MLKFISRSGMVSVEDLKDIYVEHGGIYAAIVERNGGKAQEQMVIHLANARRRYQLSGTRAGKNGTDGLDRFGKML
jgi:DNA-binding FadR family transcriptional regulator